MNRRKMLAALCLLFAVGGIILAEFEAEADSQNAIIIFGDGTRQLEGSLDNTQYAERESFTHDLLSKAEDHDYVMAEITVEEQEAEPAAEPGASVIVPAQEGTVLVQPGDSLWKIAERCLGDGSRYTTIYDRNRALIGDDPRLILPGMELDLGSPE